VADAGGGLYTIRPIRPDDADMLQAFVRGLSQESRYFRFASAMPELPARMLARYTLIDYDREMALVAVHKERHAADDGGFTETERIIGVSRYITNPDQTSCEFSLVVADDFKGQGLGSRLMLSIIDVRARQGPGRDRRPDPGQQHQHAAADAQPGLHDRAFPEDPDFKLASKALSSARVRVSVW
jgi:acetyltransferase